MLAVARILRTGAKLLLLDEISEGLAPVIVQGLSRTIHAAARTGDIPSSWWSRTSDFAAPLADRFYIMEHGRIVEAFAASELDRHRWPWCTSTWASDSTDYTF